MIVTDTNERTPLKGAVDPNASPVNRDSRQSPPPPYAAGHYPFPSPHHYSGPPIAPIQGIPPPVPYSPHPHGHGPATQHWPPGGGHLPAPYYHAAPPARRRNVTRTTLKRFLGAYLAAILVLFFVGMFLGGLDAAGNAGRYGRQHLTSWAEETFDIQFGTRAVPDCVCMPGSGPSAPPPPPSGDDQSIPSALPIDHVPLPPL